MTEHRTEKPGIGTVFRWGRLFMNGWYSEEREWVDGDEYRRLRQLADALQEDKNRLLDRLDEPCKGCGQ